MTPFTYDALPGRVVFGPGRRAQIAQEVDALSATRVMLIAGENAGDAAEGIGRTLGHRVARHWDEVAQHVPERLAERATRAAEGAGADLLLCVGGGSTIGLAKAVALVSNTPIVAVPTTYSGSEMTPIYGITGEHKRTGRDLRVLPRTVIYDPELTLDLPLTVTAPSAFNALAHCVEALYGPQANPVTSLMAEDAIRSIAAALPEISSDPRNIGARSRLLYGAYLAGTALAVVGMALHHKICHVLGGTHGLVHGDVNAAVLAHVVAFNARCAPGPINRVAAALGTTDAASSLFDLAAETGAPTSLAQLGLDFGVLDAATQLAVAATTFNPRPVDTTTVRSLLVDAWHGRRPVLTPRAGDVLAARAGDWWNTTERDAHERNACD